MDFARHVREFKSTRNWSLSNLVALLRWNLFTYRRDLWKSANDPYYSPAKPPDIVQLKLPLLDSNLSQKGSILR